MTSIDINTKPDKSVLVSLSDDRLAEIGDHLKNIHELIKCNPIVLNINTDVSFIQKLMKLRSRLDQITVIRKTKKTQIKKILEDFDTTNNERMEQDLANLQKQYTDVIESLKEELTKMVEDTTSHYAKATQPSTKQVEYSATMKETKLWEKEI